MKVVAIVQARCGSTRLPGKVLMDLLGEPMLARVVARVQRAGTLGEEMGTGSEPKDAGRGAPPCGEVPVPLSSHVVVATTLEPADEAIARLCAARGWPCYRGSQDDVLDRFYQAARQHGAEAVVRITSDCPLIDPAVIDQVVNEFLERQPKVDYASNVLMRRTFPRGLDTEVFSFVALQRAWQEDRNPAWREHVTPYFYRHPEMFRLHAVFNATDCSDMRWSVDTAEDWALVLRIYEHFGHDRFSWREALELVRQRPQWLEVNRHIAQKEVQA